MSPSTGPKHQALPDQAKGLCDRPKAAGGEHKPDEGGSERSEACCATRRRREHRPGPRIFIVPQDQDDAQGARAQGPAARPCGRSLVSRRKAPHRPSGRGDPRSRSAVPERDHRERWHRERSDPERPTGTTERHRGSEGEPTPVQAVPAWRPPQRPRARPRPGRIGPVGGRSAREPCHELAAPGPGCVGGGHRRRCLPPGPREPRLPDLSITEEPAGSAAPSTFGEGWRRRDARTPKTRHPTETDKATVERCPEHQEAADEPGLLTPPPLCPAQPTGPPSTNAERTGTAPRRPPTEQGRADVGAP